MFYIDENSMSTSNKIVNLLNRKAWTVNEIAKKLSISRNAAHLQISKLAAAGIVEKNMQRHPNGAGKPAYEYCTATGKEDTFSSAYKPLLDVLMQTMRDDLNPKTRINLFENTGRMLAINSGLRPSNDLKSDIKKSLEAVNGLGAMAELTCENNKNYISCYSCPVATLVHSEPLTCNLVAAFFSEATGKKVSIQCNREKTVVCGFVVDQA